ncbi:SfnB family sulfur acquisition oxidoreductase [Paracidovorax konjaci]|uniref:Sulfur acquisition oxidoreductase, SfnB family n=1 Tax=Paracidovorax konjaci TaxID=32040 RepID=A0A1I1ZIG3_9BURK|nr:SfnB family sulfur acquisition oxidoreductase [Paracidovorax konjaci]SFE31402.1 sulfur acquisition oxidoreductase, SfnB family [Paracidovorax konjaci]
MASHPLDDLSAGGRLPLPPRPPHRIASEAEALDVARALARDFRQEAAVRDRERRLPWDEIERHTASGLGAISVPRAYGGLGASFRTLMEVFAILCAADASLGQIPQNHYALVRHLVEFGSESQRRRFFADVLAGHRLGNAGPERKARAALVNQATARVERDAQGVLRASGTRHYSTGAMFAHWMPFRAVDALDRPVQVWVRRTAPGVRVIDDWDAFGQRTTASGSVVLENVPVGDDDVVALHAGQDRPTLAGPFSQLLQASIDLGIAEGALDDALAYVRDKTRPWIDSGLEHAHDDPHILHEVGALAIDVHAAREVLAEAADLLDALAQRQITDADSAEASVAVARAKVLTTEAALRAGEHLLELAGTSSVRAAHNLDRHWRNARVHTLHDPVRWKYHLIGRFVLNGEAPRRHQWN